jgi:large subunit ribosomal protein L25
VKIPLQYINKQKSIAIKKGAFLNIARYFVQIKCKGSNIPHSFTIDLENTDVMDRFYIENLDLPEGCQILSPKQLLCNFVSKRGKAIKA